MKSRYNLRVHSSKPLLSPNRKKPFKPQPTRRQSLRLTRATKPIRQVNKQPNPIDHDEDNVSLTNENNNNAADDDYDQLLARHQRHMLDERKDRKLYERYVRDQRILRRLQCRRTHTAHLKEATRNRLLRELERERRETIHEKICSHLADHRLIFRHRCHIESKQSMNWSTLEEEICFNRNIGTIHELDVMINNLKKGTKMAKSLISKPRLSVRERQKQRLEIKTSSIPSKSENLSSTETPPVISHPTLNIPPQFSSICLSPRVPIVRFTDIPTRTSNSQHLTCIQNVLSHQSQTSNEISTPTSSRLLRQKSTHLNFSESSPAKKRPLEKENCSIPSGTPSDSSIRTSSPMVSIKHTSSTSSSRIYPNTRKHHPMMSNSLTTRRQTRISANV